MIKHEILNLQLTDTQIKSLKAHNQKIFQYLEKGLPLKMAVLGALKGDITGIVNSTPDWKRVLENIHDSGDYYCLHLLHPDNEILNLPWSMAVDAVSGQPLGSIRQLYLTKSIPQHFKEESKVTARDFANAVNCNPSYKVPMVVLSSCQTAQGSSEKGLRGVTNHLLRIGVPVVVSMGMSIKDHYAAQFSAHFYSQVVQQQTIFSAFNQSVEHIRKNEYNDLLEAHVTPAVPLQWIIPNLYLSQQLDRVVDWDQPQEKLEMLQNFLMEQGYIHVISEINQYEKGMEKFLYLVFTIAQKYKYQPVFMFDNLETFQSEPGQSLSEEFSDIKAIIEFLCGSEKFHVILISRYPVPDLRNVQSFDLNQVGLNDFWKKCLYLDVGYIHTYLQEVAAGQDKQGVPPQPVLPFIDIVKLLHQTFGGNYRALEFFNQLLRENPGKIKNALDSLEKFQRDSREAVEEVKQKMGQSLLFTRLMLLLEPNRRRILALLSGFRVPVQLLALQMQAGQQKQQEPVDLPAALEHLHRLTLIEISLNREVQAAYYYVTPIVKDLMAGYKKEEDLYRFSHEKAGIYYYQIFYNIEESLTPLEEAFYHYDQSGNKDKVQDIGTQLSGIYYGYSMYRNAYFYAQRVYELLGDETNALVLNRLGEIYKLYGDYNNALNLYQKALSGHRKNVDKAGEGTTLDNISQIYFARGDYETALKYLEKSLNIRQEVGDKAGEGATLNNMATTAHARGDYETALKYLEKCLKIFHDIGDKQHEGRTLNNMATTAHVRGDYETALKYLEQSLKIQQEIGDKSGEGATLNNISQIYSTRGDYETALKYLEQSLKIRQEIGDKSGTIPTLHNMASIAFKKKDNGKFMEYETTAYKIAMETQNAMGIYQVGRLLGKVLYQMGNKKEGIVLLKRSLEIGKAAGFPDVGEIEEMLRGFGGTVRAEVNQ